MPEHSRLRNGLCAAAGFAVLLAAWPARAEGPSQPAEMVVQAPPAAKEGADQPKDKARAAAVPPKEDIFSLPIEQLGTIPARINVASGFSAPVTTVSRELELPVGPTRPSGPTVGTSPAAVYVITAE